MCLGKFRSKSAAVYGPKSPLHLSGYRCRLRRSTQHLLAVYSLESGTLRFFLDVDSSAARLGRAALERWGTGRFLAGSIVVGADWCFRSFLAARDFADRRNRLLRRWLR